jgi:hypothetical protein
MGSHIELNDTLQITLEQGFPKELVLEKHLKKPFKADDFKGKIFSFCKSDIRIYHPSPIRVFLVQNINGKWLYWGHCVILQQTINASEKTTSGKYQIIQIYTPEHQKNMSKYETPEGQEYIF